MKTVLMLAAVAAAAAGPWPLQTVPVTSGGAGGPTVRLTDFGGSPDAADNLPAFIKAFAQLARTGGTLIVPKRPGSGESLYLSRPLRITLSNLTLVLEAGVRIKALSALDWPTVAPWANGIDGDALQYAPFIHAVNVSDLVITGPGIIDGDGFFWYRANSQGQLRYGRPRLAVIEGCRRVELSRFGTNASGFWNLVVLESSDVHIHHVTVRNPSGGRGGCTNQTEDCYGPNADGIDLVSVTRALVEHNDIISGDDAICIKSGRNQIGRAHSRPCTDVRARYNLIRSASCPHVFHGLGDGCGALKVGTEMSGGIHNILFEHNTVGYAGIALKLSTPEPRGGEVTNVTWRNIEILSAGMAVGVDVNLGTVKGHRTPPPEDVARVTGVVFENIVARNLTCCQGCVDYGCDPKHRSAGWLQAGSEPSALGPGGVHGLRLQNVSVLAAGRAPLSDLSWRCTPGSLHGAAMAVSPALNASCVTAEAERSPAVRQLRIAYSDDLAGHRELGRAIGAEFGPSIRRVMLEAPDPELQLLLRYTNGTQGAAVLASLARDSKAAFPLYWEELEGMSDGSGVPVGRLVVNNFREELVQLAEPKLRVAKCSSVMLNQPSGMLLGHTDDWTQDWRTLAYFITATRRSDSLSWGSWVYPGYLPGMDISWNSHGLVYTVNSLFPRRYQLGGIGTAFAARHLLTASSLDQAIARAAQPNVSTAMSYQLGWRGTNSRLVQLEVDTGGGRRVAQRAIGPGESYFHGNEFKELKEAKQFPDNSTQSRANRWRQMQPIQDLGGMRRFLGDTEGNWPVYRNHTGPDDCFSEVTGIFDLMQGVLNVWTGNCKLGPPDHVFTL